MKKRLIIFGTLLLIIVTVIVIIVFPSSWSKRSFESVVREEAHGHQGIISITVEKITEVYGDPICELHVTEDTKIIDGDGNMIPIEKIKMGSTLEVTLKDSSVEGNPTYYPTVYEIRIINQDK